MADGAHARELAQRSTGSVDVVLLWHPGIDSLELALYDRATGAGCQVEVPPANGIDAFYHPYVYALACDAHRERDATVVDG